VLSLSINTACLNTRKEPPARVLKAAASREGLENKSDEVATAERQFHRLRNRLHLSVGDECFQRLEEHAGENLRRALQVRIDFDDDRAGLLGVGYIIGPRIGSIMCAGGVLAYLCSSSDQILRRKLIGDSRARRDADQSNDTG